MSTRIVDMLPQVAARWAGALYLAIIAGGLFAEAFVRGALIIPGDPVVVRPGLGADTVGKIEAMYDARFYRMWEFYLCGGIVMFESGGGCNYQIQYIRDRRALPITRDYMAEAEKRLKVKPNGTKRKGATQPRRASPREKVPA